MKGQLVAGLLAFAVLGGCATGPTPPTFETAAKSEFLAANYRAADALIAQFRDRTVGGPLLVATLVSIDALERSSTLGRVISEQISARFSQAGLSVIEMKFRNSVYMKRAEGELLLTREIADVARSHSAQAVIVGTYGLSADLVFINVKIVEPGSNKVLAVHDYALPLNRDIRSMLPKPTTDSYGSGYR